MSVRMMMQGRKPAAGGGSFDPLSISWTHAFWAEDPSWTPPSDGAALTSGWRNAGSHGGTATGTNTPTYRSSYTNLNSQPAIEFDGTNDQLVQNTTGISQPTHVFVVGWLDSTTGASPTILDGWGARNLLRNLGPTNGVQMFAGTSQTFSGGVWGDFAMDALFNGASSECRVNGSALTIGGTVGTQGLTGIDIGWDGGSNFYKGAIAFLGVKAGALTTQERADLLDWARSHYGTP